MTAPPPPPNDPQGSPQPGPAPWEQQNPRMGPPQPGQAPWNQPQGGHQQGTWGPAAPPPGQPHQGQPQAGYPQPGQPQPGQNYPGQPYSGHPQPGQQQPGQQQPGQPLPGQQPYLPKPEHGPYGGMPPGTGPVPPYTPGPQHPTDPQQWGGASQHHGGGLPPGYVSPGVPTRRGMAGVRQFVRRRSTLVGAGLVVVLSVGSGLLFGTGSGREGQCMNVDGDSVFTSSSTIDCKDPTATYKIAEVERGRYTAPSCPDGDYVESEDKSYGSSRHRERDQYRYCLALNAKVGDVFTGSAGAPKSLQKNGENGTRFRVAKIVPNVSDVSVCGGDSSYSLYYSDPVQTICLHRL